MNPADVEQIIRDGIKDLYHLSLATSRDNKPWVCEVHFGYDQELNLYFISLPTRRHSEDIAYNPRVAGNIIPQYSLEAPDILGIYFEGTCKKLENETDKQIAFRALQEHINLSAERLKESRNPGEHQFYKISVKEWSIFGRFGGPSGVKHTIKWSSQSPES